MRLVHPFPSLLDGLVGAGIAFLATGEPVTAVRLGLSMMLLQASIGALNDLVDAPTDAGRKPGKPIPAGVVGPGQARVTVSTTAIVGIVLAIPSGIALIALAGFVLAIGYGYDLLAKGTAWSWVPFAVGIPLLPLYGWLGAAGAVPGWFVVLLPMAVLAGAAVAIANARADVERDLSAGVGSIATHLGLERSWWVGTVLLGAALALAVGWLGIADDLQGQAAGLIGLGSLLAATGLALARASSPERRERAWQFQAIGIAIVGLGWVWATTTG